ncbi:Osmoprotectant-binding protein OsmX [anaerobic digester metagenome]
MSRRAICAVIILLGVSLLVAGCLQSAGDSGTHSSKSVVIGAMPFNEQYILSEMLAILLEQEGFDVEVRSGLQNSVLYEGVKGGQVDAYVEYTSAALFLVPNGTKPDSFNTDAVFEAVRRGTEADGVMLVGRTGFRNDNQVAVPSAWAAARNVTRLSDLAPYAAEMTFGSDLVFADAEDGLPLLEATYGYRFGDVRRMDPALTFEAIRTGQVDAIVTYTTDGRIDLFNLTVLEDDRGGLPPYEAMLLVTSSRANDPRFTMAVGKLVGAITSEDMRRMNAAFDSEKRDAQEIAREFLVSRSLA